MYISEFYRAFIRYQKLNLNDVYQLFASFYNSTSQTAKAYEKDVDLQLRPFLLLDYHNDIIITSLHQTAYSLF